jgi:aerotaxis receptor
MRQNLPVQNVEFPFPPGDTLVSTTDLKGRILYCNAAFVSVSGFTKEELLGQPHNLVRHPDMPEEAYRDMWETIGRGLPWSAPVKNRRKDGSYYWVIANVTPLMDGNAPSGYMSVRTQPTREQVAAAEQLYARMRQEKTEGQRVTLLSEGAVQIHTPWARVQRAFNIGMRGRMSLIVGSVAALCSAAGAAFGGTPLTSAAVLGEVALSFAAGAAVGGLWLSRMAIQPLEELVRVANRMAAGDLTQRIDASGQDTLGRLGKALAQLNVNLRSIVRDARNEVNHMRDATREIAAGNQDLSARTESQAASLEETASSMEQITSTVRNSATSAQKAAELASEASAVTQRGSDAINEVTRTMHTISDSSRRIGEIISVIDSIAFQTNILALNAAVEAARAGEQGRGFAVVASEVRSLAQRTTGAAREIKQLIEDSAQKVDTGNRMTEEAQKTMDGALATVQRVTHVIAEISTGASEQLSGISQVNEAVSQMDSITQQNAALVEQIAASAVQLQSQAVAVSESVQVFKLDAGPAAAVPDAVSLRKRMAQTKTATQTKPKTTEAA